MPTYKLDSNHDQIVNMFLSLGCRVAEVARSRSDVPGIPDLVIGIPNHWMNRYTIVWVEIKTEKGSLSPAQECFMNEWGDYPVAIIKSENDAFDLCRKYGVAQ